MYDKGLRIILELQVNQKPRVKKLVEQVHKKFPLKWHQVFMHGKNRLEYTWLLRTVMVFKFGCTKPREGLQKEFNRTILEMFNLYQDVECQEASGGVKWLLFGGWKEGTTAWIQCQRESCAQLGNYIYHRRDSNERLNIEEEFDLIPSTLNQGYQGHSTVSVRDY